MSEKWGQKNESPPLRFQRGAGKHYLSDPDISDILFGNNLKQVLKRGDGDQPAGTSSRTKCSRIPDDTVDLVGLAPDARGNSAADGCADVEMVFASFFENRRERIGLCRDVTGQKRERECGD